MYIRLVITFDLHKKNTSFFIMYTQGGIVQGF